MIIQCCFAYQNIKCSPNYCAKFKAILFNDVSSCFLDYLKTAIHCHWSRDMHYGNRIQCGNLIIINKFKNQDCISIDLIVTQGMMI